jgi:hypothetical protein
VSAGNILIVNGRGILIDWDLSKRLMRTGSSANELDVSDGQTLPPGNEVRQPTRMVCTAVILVQRRTDFAIGYLAIHGRCSCQESERTADLCG